MSSKKELAVEPKAGLGEIRARGTIGKLNHRQYSMWKFSIYEMQLADSKLQAANAEAACLRLAQENAQLKTQVYVKTKVEVAQEKSLAAKVEYEKKKEELEKQIGYSLNDKAIDEVTLEVKDLNLIK